METTIQHALEFVSPEPNSRAFGNRTNLWTGEQRSNLTYRWNRGIYSS